MTYASLTSPADGIDSSSGFQPDPPPAMEPRVSKHNSCKHPQARDHAGKPLKHFLPADLSSPDRLFAPGLGDVKAGMLEEDARSVAIGLLTPQLTALFTSAPILASSAAVTSFSAKAVG